MIIPRTSESGLKTFKISVFVRFATLIILPVIVARSASLDPECGVPRKAIARVLSNISFCCRSALFEIISASGPLVSV